MYSYLIFVTDSSLLPFMLTHVRRIGQHDLFPCKLVYLEELLSGIFALRDGSIYATVCRFEPGNETSYVTVVVTNVGADYTSLGE